MSECIIILSASKTVITRVPVVNGFDFAALLTMGILLFIENNW
jgi:hypothetical protein